MSNCKCIIWHPDTEEERQAQLKRYELAAKSGQTAIATMYLASLFNPCPAKEESANGTVVQSASA